MAGSPPFTGSDDELCDKHLHSSPEIPVAWGPQVKTLVSMMMRKSPEARPSLARVLKILGTVANGSSLDRLAAAAAEHEKKQNEAEAERQRAIDIQKKREELGIEARAILKSIFSDVVGKIIAAIPNAKVRELGGSVFIEVGAGSLEFDLRIKDGILSSKSFPHARWDVVCGAVVEVKQSSIIRCAANLWYTRMSNPNGEYRWYEVGYQGNPIMGKRFEYEPAAVDVRSADIAHAPIIGAVQPAYQPIPIDYEGVGAFCQRWADILADACPGKSML
jgi:hypothetical protein